MLFRTHLVITLFFLFLFFQFQNPIVFLAVSVIATAIPDIDTKYSKIGHYKISRIFNFFVKHRGITHSFTFLLVLSFFIFLFSREISFAFAFGYSLHLLSDALTVSGIMPFYPLKLKIKGKIRTGGFIETFVFVIFFLVDLFLIFSRIFSIF